MYRSKYLLLLVLLTSAACRIDGNNTIDEKDLNFSTTDDSELFFKNVRQLSYDLQEIPAANLNVYRIKERSLSEEYPVINLAIVWNWLKDEAYILIEPNEMLLEEDPITVYWNNPLSSEEGVFKYSPGNNVAQLNFTNELYNGIIDNNIFEIQVNNSKSPFLDVTKDRESFRKTMADYFRLTRTFKN